MDNNTNYRNLCAFEILFIDTPNPPEDHIKYEMQYDRSQNPHNDSYKPPLRSRNEIIADFKIKYANDMIKRFNKYINKE